MCKVFSDSELNRMSETELSVLFHKVSSGLVQAEPSSPERRAGLASLEKINRAVAQRRKAPKPRF